MDGVLRASGGEAEGIDPQPAIADLSTLAAESEVNTDLGRTSDRLIFAAARSARRPLVA